MLNLLITSRTRRKLLEFFWKHNGVANVARVSGETGCGYAACHDEMKTLEAAGLLRRTSPGDGKYCANRAHPCATALDQLLKYCDVVPAGDAELRSQLQAAGMPVDAGFAVAPATDLEALTVKALHLARADASVARAFPVFLHRQFDALDWTRIKAMVRSDSDAKHILGLFLELTGTLSANESMLGLAGHFRDNRRKRLQPFFNRAPQSSFAEKLAEKRSPAVARKWGWLMNLELESFQTLFAKHAKTSAN